MTMDVLEIENPASRDHCVLPLHLKKGYHMARHVMAFLSLLNTK